jgi:hypothetical protein
MTRGFCPTCGGKGRVPDMSRSGPMSYYNPNTGDSLQRSRPDSIWSPASGKTALSVRPAKLPSASQPVREASTAAMPASWISPSVQARSSSGRMFPCTSGSTPCICS